MSMLIRRPYVPHASRLEVQGATSQLNLTKEVQDYFQKWQAARAE